MMNIEELKNKCLKSIAQEKQLAEAEHAAKNYSMENYHNGRMQVWHEVHDMLIRWF